jgi:hypothetical protein
MEEIADGKAKPFRTSGGKAVALFRLIQYGKRKTKT